MMSNIRAKAVVLMSLKEISDAQHTVLRQAGEWDSELWLKKGHELTGLVNTFRSEVKGHYYTHQLRRCCYCSKELDRHKASYNADHIIDRSDHPWLMFHMSNIAASCKTCDGRKSNKNVLAHENSFPRSPPEKSEDYLIVHPHLDEWSVHLDFDRFERVVAKGDDPKGKKTIDVCGIRALNNARLANHFSPDKSGVAEDLIEKFFELKRKSRREKLITFLRDLAGTSEAARLVVDSLQAEL